MDFINLLLEDVFSLSNSNNLLLTNYYQSLAIYPFRPSIHSLYEQRVCKFNLNLQSFQRDLRSNRSKQKRPNFLFCHKFKRRITGFLFVLLLASDVIVQTSAAASHASSASLSSIIRLRLGVPFMLPFISFWMPLSTAQLNSESYKSNLSTNFKDLSLAAFNLSHHFFAAYVDSVDKSTKIMPDNNFYENERNQKDNLERELTTNEAILQKALTPHLQSSIKNGFNVKSKSYTNRELNSLVAEKTNKAPSIRDVLPANPTSRSIPCHQTVPLDRANLQLEQREKSENMYQLGKMICSFHGYLLASMYAVIITPISTILMSKEKDVQPLEDYHIILLSKNRTRIQHIPHPTRSWAMPTEDAKLYGKEDSSWLRTCVWDLEYKRGFGVELKTYVEKQFNSAELLAKNEKLFLIIPLEDFLDFYEDSEQLDCAIKEFQRSHKQTSDIDFCSVTSSKELSQYRYFTFSNFMKYFLDEIG